MRPSAQSSTRQSRALPRKRALLLEQNRVHLISAPQPARHRPVRWKPTQLCSASVTSTLLQTLLFPLIRGLQSTPSWDSSFMTLHCSA